MQLMRHPANPIIPYDRKSRWRQDHTADPVLIRVGDQWRLYVRGRLHVENQYDAEQLVGTIHAGLFTATAQEFDGATWREYADNPIIRPGKRGEFDDIGTFLGDIMPVDDGYLLFGHAVCHDWRIDVDKGIGKGGKAGTLLKSPDGIRWSRAIDRPLTKPFSASHVAVRHEGAYHVFYNRRCEDDSTPMMVARSVDPRRLDESAAETVLPVGEPGAWDSATVQNPRVWRDGDVWYLIYAGSDRYMDNPHHFGLAASHDLTDWVRYEGNPIFSRGAEGQWDDNSLWPGSCVHVGDTYYLYYEGRCCNEPQAQADARATGRGYGGTSQIGLATMTSDVFFFRP